MEWMHPLAEVQGALRAAGLIIDAFEEHLQVPWQIFPITVPQGDGMFGWPAEQWLPLSYELVASAAALTAPGAPLRPRTARQGARAGPDRGSCGALLGARTLSPMGVVAQVLAVVEGLALVVVGVIGAFFFRSRRLYSFLLIEPEDQEAVRPWAIYTGFANMLWGSACSRACSR